MRLGRFWRATLTVLGGSLAAQAWPMLAAPIITRLCGPEDVGAFSVWFGVAAIASVAATLRLEHAMVLEPRRSRQRVCFSTVAWSATWLALLLTAGCALARLLGWEFLSWAGVASVGLAAWLMAAMQTMLGYATSHAAFAAAARARVCAAAAIALAQVGLLSAGAGAPALLAGHLAGSAAGLLAARYLLRPPLPRTLSWPPCAARAVRRGADQGADAAAAGAMPALSPAVPGAAGSGAGLVAGARHATAEEETAVWPGATGAPPRLPSWASRTANCLLRLMLPSPAQRSYLARHQGFWRYALWSGLLNAAVSQLPVLLIAWRGGGGGGGGG
ncbi:lipopolysaccharide biosynthesis protein, partial [Oxalobacteraceae bacterium A2-2]